MLFNLPASQFSGLLGLGYSNNSNIAFITDYIENDGDQFSFKISAHTSPVLKFILGWKIGSKKYNFGANVGYY